MALVTKGSSIKSSRGRDAWSRGSESTPSPLSSALESVCKEARYSGLSVPIMALLRKYDWLAAQAPCRLIPHDPNLSYKINHGWPPDVSIEYSWLPSKTQHGQHPLKTMTLLSDLTRITSQEESKAGLLFCRGQILYCAVLTCKW